MCPPDGSVNMQSKDMKYARRFASYNKRFEEMKQSYDLDVNQFMVKKVEKVELELKSDWIKLEFIGQAIDTLLQCRRTLMHSYIFSFFMTTLDNQMFMFEENLKYLQLSTAALSEVLEKEVNDNTVAQLREKTIDGIYLCKQQRRSLINHIKEGYAKKWWRKFPIPAEELAAAEAAAGDEAIHQLIY